MGLTKYKLCQLIELTTDTNKDLVYSSKDVMGMTITKEIIKTKANVSAMDLSKFLIVKEKEFIFNPRTHGKKIGFGYNNLGKTFIISWNNIAFRVKDDMKNIILSDYLFLHFKRDEWDREACFQSWGSSTEVFSWETLIEMVIELPSVKVQQKYVDIYNAMVENQKSYKKGLNDLKLTCEAYIENLKKEMQCKQIGNYIEQVKDKNSDDSINEVYGVSNTLQFVEASTSVDKNNLSNYKIVNYQDIAYVPTTHMKIYAVAISDKKQPFVVSPIYEVFRIKDKNILSPEYLFLWLCRNETIRYAFYNSWGSARENFNYEDMSTVSLPIPSIEIQNSIVDIFESYRVRKKVNEQLKNKIKDICPILIKGSLIEGKKET